MTRTCATKLAVLHAGVSLVFSCLSALFATISAVEVLHDTANWARAAYFVAAACMMHIAADGCTRTSNRLGERLGWKDKKLT